MAQYYTNFGEYTSGAAPTGWTSRAISQTWTIIDDAAATGGKRLKVSGGSDGNAGLSWDSIDSDANRANVEVLMRIQSSSRTAGENYCGAMVRAYASGGYLYGYAARIIRSSVFVDSLCRVQLVKMSGTSWTTPADYVFDWQASTDCWVRFRANGTSLRVRIWAVGAAEPGTWHIDHTDSTYGSAGWVGAYNYESNGNKLWDVFSVGTNGETANSTPPVTPVSRQFPASWAIRGLVTRQFPAVWAIKDTDPVSRLFPASWAIRGLVTRSFPASWAIRNLVSREFPASWEIHPFFHFSPRPTAWQSQVGPRPNRVYVLIEGGTTIKTAEVAGVAAADKCDAPLIRVPSTTTEAEAQAVADAALAAYQARPVYVSGPLMLNVQIGFDRLVTVIWYEQDRAVDGTLSYVLKEQHDLQVVKIVHDVDAGTTTYELGDAVPDDIEAIVRAVANAKH